MIIVRIDLGNAFRIHVSVAKYTTNVDYGSVEMDDQEHDVWIDLTSHCSLSKFVNEMAGKIIWGSGQQLVVWGLDKESGTEWKVTTDEQFREMIEARWDEKEMDVSCEVLDKDKVSSRQNRDAAAGNVTNEHSVHATSDVIVGQGNVECTDDACSSPEHTKSDDVVIDWSAFTILPEENLDGDATILVDEEQIYEAMGFKATDEGIAGADGPPEILVPEIPPEVEEEMEAAAIPVDDNEATKPLFFYDRDNPDMSVDTLYLSMPKFRLVVKQHAIVNEFELSIEKSDTSRFRGYCKSQGCKWIIRARTQRDNSVRVYY